MMLADGGRPNRLAMWLGHYQAYFLAFFLLMSAVSGIWPVLTWPHRVFGGVLLLAVIANMVLHGNRLCELCISRAPACNPQAAVDRWRYVLRFCHRPVIYFGLLLPVVVFVVIGVMVRTAVWLDRAGAIWLMFVLGGSQIAWHQHQRLKPWCPWCRHDGGDEDAAAPVPETPLERV